MKHQTQTMIKNAMIILAASSALSIATCSFGDSQGVDYAADQPTQQTYQCKISTDPNKVVQLKDDNSKAQSDNSYYGCEGINKYYYNEVVDSNYLTKLEFDENNDPVNYVQVYSKIIHLKLEPTLGAFALKNDKENLRTYCAPVECVYDNAESAKLYTCKDATGGTIPC